MELRVIAETKDDILTALPFIKCEIEHGFTSGIALGASWKLFEKVETERVEITLKKEEPRPMGNATIAARNLRMGRISSCTDYQACVFLSSAGLNVRERILLKLSAYRSHFTRRAKQCPPLQPISGVDMWSYKQPTSRTPGEKSGNAGSLTASGSRTMFWCVLIVQPQNVLERRQQPLIWHGTLR